MRVPSSLGQVIRTVAPDEAALVAAVGELTVGAFVADGFLSADDGYAEHLRNADARAREAVLAVALSAGGGSGTGSGEDHLLGTVTYCRHGELWSEVADPGESEFRMLAVAPSARGLGVGGALASWCLDRARADRAYAVVLSSLVEMTGAHRIYSRLGFVRTPDKDWWPEPATRLITFRLEL